MSIAIVVGVVDDLIKKSRIVFNLPGIIYNV